MHVFDFAGKEDYAAIATREGRRLDFSGRS